MPIMLFMVLGNLSEYDTSSGGDGFPPPSRNLANAGWLTAQNLASARTDSER